MIRDINHKTVRRNTLLVAVFILETLVCSIIDAFISISYISVWVMLLLLGLFFCFNKVLRAEQLKRFIAFIGIITLILLVSMIKNGAEYVGNTIVYFLAFGVTASLLSMITIDYKLLYLYLVRISGLYLLIYFLVIRHSFLSSSDYWSSQMGVAYGAVLVFVVSLVFYSERKKYNYQRKDRLFALLNMIIALYIVFVDCGTRGAWISVVVALFAVSLSRQNTVKKILVLLVGLILSVLVIANLEAVLIAIEGILNSFGINMPALSKAVFMLKNGMMDNGRNQLYGNALDIIRQNVVWGNGVGYYESYYNEGYIHNFVLQLMCEFGLIGAVPVLFLIVKDVTSNLMNTNRDHRIRMYNLMLFLISIPLLMVSSAYWLLPQFWLYFSGIIIKSRKKYV